MTEKQFSALRITVIGAAFFIGGAVFTLTNREYGVLFMALGGLLLVKDALIRGLIWFLNFDGNMPKNYTEIKEREENDDKNEPD